MTALRARGGLLGFLPTVVDWRVRFIASASLAAEILLVATGGLVRLTDSGLGCPTWPRCTAGSFVTTPAMGIHGVIEFGNRMLTGVLVVVAILAVLAVLRLRRSRRDLFVLALVQLLSIPAQAVLGGVTVLSKLNPWLVGAHFVFSLILVALMAAFVVQAVRIPGPRVRIVPLAFAIGVHVASLLVAVTLVLGVLTTGAGPHAGDAHSIRNGFDPVVLQVSHSYPAYALAAVAAALLIAAFVLRRMRAPMVALAVVLALQITIGVIQAASGLPAGLVDAHEALAAVLVAVTTWVVLAVKPPKNAGDHEEFRSRPALDAAVLDRA